MRYHLFRHIFYYVLPNKIPYKNVLSFFFFKLYILNKIMNILELRSYKGGNKMPERTLSVDEKIKRAEEIYNRRMNNNPRTQATTVSVSDKRDYKLLKKMLLQILVCFLIYFIYYLVQNSTYIFSQEFLKKTKEILSYNIDIEEVYKQIKIYFMENTTNASDESIENEIKEVNETQTNTVEEALPEAVNTVEETLSITEELVEEVSSISQMQIDAEQIKGITTFQIPLNGIITSRFGTRDSNEVVSGYHQGLDIAANVGTKILAAMEGDVSFISTEGGYGKQIRITNGDILTIYAHCNEIYVEQGQHITKGQEIGEVGQTRKCDRSTSTF